MKKVLYRKYRPLNFEDVVGQEIVVRTLQNAIRIGEVSHAYIFSGPKGTGKTSLARIFARTLNCADEGVDCCNKCEFCLDKDSMDIIEIDAASNNGVDEVREIRDKLTLLPTKSKYKIYIIDEIHMMTTGAFNALLKSIEEPPEHVVFVLATTEFYKIPDTIKSRCQIMNFNSISKKDIVSRLIYICEKEKINVEDGVLNEIALTSSGSFRDAISNLDMLKTFSNYNIKIEDVLFFNSSLSITEIRNFLDEIVKSEKIVDNFLIKINDENLNSFVIIEHLLLETKDRFLNASTNKNAYYNLFIFLNGLYTSMLKSNFPTLLFQIEIMNYVEKNSTDVEKKNYTERISLSKEVMKPLSENVVEINKDLSESNDNQAQIDDEKLIERVSALPNNKDKRDEILNQIQDIRINNLFTDVSRKMLSDVLKCYQTVREYMIDDKYKFYANLLLNGQIVAASKNYCSFVFDSVDKSNEFNLHAKSLDKLFSKIIGWEMKVIASYKDNWEIRKKEYKMRKGTYVYDESEQNLFEILKTMNIVDKNDIEIEFNDIINYS